MVFMIHRGFISKWWSSCKYEKDDHHLANMLDDDHHHAQMSVNMRTNARMDEAWRLGPHAIWLARGSSDLKIKYSLEKEQIYISCVYDLSAVKVIWHQKLYFAHILVSFWMNIWQKKIDNDFDIYDDRNSKMIENWPCREENHDDVGYDDDENNLDDNDDDDDDDDQNNLDDNDDDDCGASKRGLTLWGRTLL